ncbi:MAG: hypothetical protein K0R25_394 [Rickettsiaceae bacterium]|jgi:hypothetical protein|nr:hypothetical protein [Rickettsiaceae bacterium]
MPTNKSSDQKKLSSSQSECPAEHMQVIENMLLLQIELDEKNKELAERSERLNKKEVEIIEEEKESEMQEIDLKRREEELKREQEKLAKKAHEILAQKEEIDRRDQISLAMEKDVVARRAITEKRREEMVQQHNELAVGEVAIKESQDAQNEQNKKLMEGFTERKTEIDKRCKEVESQERIVRGLNTALREQNDKLEKSAAKREDARNKRLEKLLEREEEAERQRIELSQQNEKLLQQIAKQETEINKSRREWEEQKRKEDEKQKEMENKEEMDLEEEARKLDEQERQLVIIEEKLSKRQETIREKAEEAVNKQPNLMLPSLHLGRPETISYDETRGSFGFEGDDERFEEPPVAFESFDAENIQNQELEMWQPPLANGQYFGFQPGSVEFRPMQNPPQYFPPYHVHPSFIYQQPFVIPNQQYQQFAPHQQPAFPPMLHENYRSSQQRARADEKPSNSCAPSEYNKMLVKRRRERTGH